MRRPVVFVALTVAVFAAGVASTGPDMQPRDVTPLTAQPPVVFTSEGP